jgi:hypothetical protein
VLLTLFYVTQFLYLIPCVPCFALNAWTCIIFSEHNEIWLPYLIISFVNNYSSKTFLNIFLFLTRISTLICGPKVWEYVGDMQLWNSALNTVLNANTINKQKIHGLHHNAGKSLNDSIIHQFKIFSSIQTSSNNKKYFQTLFIHGTVCLATGTVHNLFHQEFSTRCDLVLPLSNFTTFNFP